MVAQAHRLEIDLASLRRRFPVSLKGATLKQIVAIADQLGFNSRALRGEIADLAQVNLPAILHWDLNHFVVLKAIKKTLSGERYIILDPAVGERKLSAAELSRHFTGVILGLTPSERFQRKTETVKLRLVQLWSRMHGLKRALAQVLGLSILLQLFVLATPYYLQLAIDSALPSFDVSLLLMLACAFGGIALFQAATSALRQWILLSLGTSLGVQIVLNLFRHMLRLPQSWFEKRHVGDIISRFRSSQAVVDLLTHGLISAIIDGLMAITTLILLFVYAPTLATITLIAFLLFTTLKLATFPTMRIMNSDVIMAEAREQSIFMESVRGVQAVKLFAREGDQQRKWFNRYAEVVNAKLRMGRMTLGYDSAAQLIVALANIITIYLAVRYTMSGDMTIGMIFAFQAYRGQFTSAAQGFVDQFISYKMLSMHMGRIADIALNTPESMNDANSDTRTPLAGKIEFRGVSFKFAPHEPEILISASMQINAGETVAIIGPSGGGKTTLLKLLLGLLEPTAGEISVDDKPLHRINKRDYRRQVGAVMQDDVLFAGSIAENIAFFDADIDMARVQNAAHVASIHAEISAMTMGYESLVGDMGSALSGGQKQRVLLARALYHQPRLLVLDEGTAHLDVQTEAKVSAAIAALNITRIIVAHRPETIRTADRILLLEHGVLKEIRAPDSLPQAA